MNAQNLHTGYYDRRGSQSGLTLIELMIAMLIGVFLTFGTVTVYVQSKKQFMVSDSIARLQEDVRYALDVIEPDLRLADFWGLNNTSNPITVPGGIVVPCSTNGLDVSGNTIGNTGGGNFALQASLVVIDDVYGAPGITCPANSVAAASSDVLIVRHASGQVVPPAGPRIQVVADFLGGAVFNNGAPPPFSATAQVHDVVVNAYYVDQQSDLDPNTPSLRMKTLDGNGAWLDQELATGVENLQVQLGVDVDSDGDVDRYVDGDHALVNPIPAAGQIIAVRLWMLARAPIAENGFTDPGPYATPDLDFPAVNTGTPQIPNQNRRIQVSKTVFLRNTRI